MLGLEISGAGGSGAGGRQPCSSCSVPSLLYVIPSFTKGRKVNSTKNMKSYLALSE